MFKVSKLLHSNVLSTNTSEFNHSTSTVQLVESGRFIDLYVCLVVHTDAKLLQAVCL